MFIYPQKDGTVLWSGSFNQVEWDAWHAEHSTKTKVKAEAKAAEAEVKAEGETVKVEPVAEPTSTPVKKATPATAKKGGDK